jgi:hypothetical protein
MVDVAFCDGVAFVGGIGVLVDDVASDGGVTDMERLDVGGVAVCDSPPPSDGTIAVVDTDVTLVGGVDALEGREVAFGDVDFVTCVEDVTTGNEGSVGDDFFSSCCCCCAV